MIYLYTSIKFRKYLNFKNTNYIYTYMYIYIYIYIYNNIITEDILILLILLILLTFLNIC